MRLTLSNMAQNENFKEQELEAHYPFTLFIDFPIQK